jgi:pimeloyl-ACP methyl ester carboxylesterase
MTPLMLIHGWCCDGAAMAPVAAAFAERVVTRPTLPGFGGTAPINDLSITAQAGWIIAQLTEPTILVGHSMGAQIALEAAVQAPDRVAGVVLLDPARIVPTEKAQAFFDGMAAQLRKVDFRSMVEAFARRQIVQASDLAAVEALVSVMIATDPAVARAAWDSIITYDGAAALAKLTRPGLMIVVERPMNRPADAAKAATRTTLMTGQVTGSGHMLQFEVMDQVAAMMRRWMALTGV